MITYIFLTLFSTTACQYVNTGIKPDVTFGDENERFDISSVIKEQNRFYGIDGDFRRGNMLKEAYLLKALEETINSMRKSNADLKNTVEFRRSDADFAYHDTMDGGGTADDFEANLKKFQKEAEEHRKKLKIDDDESEDGRRMGPDSEAKVLMDHAVPIQMRVQGYFQLPLEE